MTTQKVLGNLLVLIIFLLAFPFSDVIAARLGDDCISPTTACTVMPDDDNDDDAGSINEAINRVSTSGGGVVYLEEGVFEITTFLDLAPDVALRGRNPENIPQNRSYPDPQLDVTEIKYTGPDSTFNLMVWVCPSNVEISNLTLDGNPNKNSSSNVMYGIYAQSNAMCEARNLKVRNVRIIGTARAGIECVSTEGRVAENPVIQKNTITGLTGKNGNPDRLGIELQGCHGAVVEDNALDEWLSVVHIYGCAVRRNKILGRVGNDAYPYGLEFGDGQYCIFSGNTVSNAHIGLSVSRTEPSISTAYAYWYKNTINKAAAWGAQLQGIIENGSQGGSVRAHYFYQNTFSSTGDTPCVFEILCDDSGDGFRFNEYSGDITLESNTIRNNKGSGIQLSDLLDRLSFTNNGILSNKGSAVEYSALPADIEWYRNVVSGNGDNWQPESSGFGNNNKPMARFSVRKIGPLKYRFTNKSSDPDGDPLTLLWDLGEGPAIIDTPEFEYTFSEGGKKVISLIVWDEPEENGKGRGHRYTATINVW